MADKPVTREEKYLAYLTGDYTGEIPKPITRKEKYLYELCLKGMGGEISPEEIKNAVNEYLEKNPVKPGATTEQAQQIEQNKTDIASLKEDIKEQTGSYLQGKQLFDANDFSVGACTSGLKTESQHRITNAKETFEKATPIKCKLGDTLNINVDLANSDFVGCRVGIHEISNSYFVSDSGWLQVTNKGVAYTVEHKSTVGVNVTFSFSKSSNIVATNSTEYTEKLTLDELLSNIKISVVMGDNVVSNVQLGEMYNNLKKSHYYTWNDIQIRPCI